MADKSDQEKTEQPSDKRLKDAKEKGQVPRSKELSSIGGLCCACVFLWLMGESLFVGLIKWVKQCFSVSEETLRSEQFLSPISQHLWGWVSSLLLFLILMWAVSILFSVAFGGWNWSWSACGFKFSKLSPIAGIKRIVGKAAWMELVKSILKIALVAGCAWVLWLWYEPSIFYLFFQTFPQNWLSSAQIFVSFLLLVCSALFLVVLIDIPYQFWQHQQELKMTLQEVKDEFKETEGKPEVKGRIRQLQREMAQGRMMSAVPSANVILVNPEHYSVALRYDPKIDTAPILVAKGVDHLAFRIREIAQHHEIDIVEVPPLARSIYYTTELEEAIPDGLFLAVAQVLAYVFQLDRYRQGQGKTPTLDKSRLTIPEEYQR